jgi:hypothetical protein
VVGGDVRVSLRDRSADEPVRSHFGLSSAITLANQRSHSSSDLPCTATGLRDVVASINGLTVAALHITPHTTMASKLAPWALRSSARAARSASKQHTRQFQVSALQRSEAIFVVCPTMTTMLSLRPSNT